MHYSKFDNANLCRECAAAPMPDAPLIHPALVQAVRRGSGGLVDSGDACRAIARAVLDAFVASRAKPRHSTHLMAENGGPLCRIRGYMEKPVTMNRDEVTCGRCKRCMGTGAAVLNYLEAKGE